MKCQRLRIRRTRQIFKRAALIAQSEKSTNIEELRSIEQRLKEVNDDINYYRQTSGDERTQAVNSVENRAESPKFMQGEGFKAIESRGNYDYSKIFETRGKAGADLKEKRAVNSPLSVFGELRARMRRKLITILTR